jgi:hypothetical protein
VTRIPPEVLDVYKLHLPEGSSLPRESQKKKKTQIDQKLTVRSFTSVDFPAPFGPMMPTRLRNAVITSLRHSMKLDIPR